MTIFSGSRYADALAVVQQDDTVAIRRRFPRAPLTGFVYYTWKSTDRLDIFAARQFGGAQHWWKIMDANPLIQDPSQILPGQQIRIPVGG